MTQSSTHRRSASSPHASRSKSSRPAIHRRGTSGANLSISKLGSGYSRGGSRSRNRNDETESDMAASFLNFWYVDRCLSYIYFFLNRTYCSAVLYAVVGLHIYVWTVANVSTAPCARDRLLFRTIRFSTAVKGQYPRFHSVKTPTNFDPSCRRKDSCKPLSASMGSMPSMPITPPPSPPLLPRTIVAPMIPTRAPTNPIPTDTPEIKTDLDPAEWKPSILAKRTPPSPSVAPSAWNYLSQFHGSDESLLPHKPTHYSTTSLPALIGGTSPIHITLPSLTHTASAPSSISSTTSDYLYNIHETSSSATQIRPLPPRHNPSSSSTTPKGVELVVPHIASTFEDNSLDVSDSGSIFPASSAVWEDSCEKTATTPINMARLGVRSVQVRTQEV